MGTIIVPKFLKRPEVYELPGVPELFCDLVVVRDFGETMRILLCMERQRDGPVVDLAARLIMPHGGYCRSLGWQATDFLLLRGAN